MPALDGVTGGKIIASEKRFSRERKPGEEKNSTLLTAKSPRPDKPLKTNSIFSPQVVLK
jgi:hypothetical protein